MHLFKFAISFLAVGGTTYALIKINKAPPWLIAVSVAMAVAALISALPDLPQAIDAIENAAKKVAVFRVPARKAPEAQPARKKLPAWYEPARSAPHGWQAPQRRPKCAAVVMSNRGGWGASAGEGLTCSERTERARAACSALASGQCGNYAAGLWVAGIHCGVRFASGVRRNSFAGYGATEAEAFARAYQHAADLGFPVQWCRRRVALSTEDTSPRRYD